MKNDFDRIAPFYDRLARWIYGEAILESQKWAIDKVDTYQELLIVGGGTGEILSLIPETVHVTYLDKSAKMTQLAQRNPGNGQVCVINQDFFTWQPSKKWDFVFCPFFLDCFDLENLEKAVLKCKSVLKQSGSLMVADFDLHHTPAVLKVMMHAFFRLVANLESSTLKDIHSMILRNRFEMHQEKLFHQEMIFSRVYRNL